MSKNKQLKRGYALSLLGHLNALQEATKRTSTLIMEDDADWDIDIRKQMRTIAGAIRNLTGNAADDIEAESAHTPYGTNWDILWFGYCDDSLPIDGSELSFNNLIVPPRVNL
jgi:hypothetical protein